MPEHTSEHTKKGVRGWLHTVWISIEFLSVQLADAIEHNIEVMRREVNLFLGALFLLLGLLNWSIGKYCDGNTADYLSCTRPEAFYYYGAFQIALIILGTLLVLVWLVQSRSKDR